MSERLIIRIVYFWITGVLFGFGCMGLVWWHDVGAGAKTAIVIGLIFSSGVTVALARSIEKDIKGNECDSLEK